jgi:microcystin-dependent protein
MKDKKIKRILKDVDENLSSLSKEITDNLFGGKSESEKLEEHTSSRDDLSFQKYHKPKKIEFDPQPEAAPDIVEQLAKNITSDLINEIARDVFGEEIETIEDVSPELQDKFVEMVTEQVMESPEMVQSPEEFRLSEERVKELEEQRVSSYIKSLQKISDVKVVENELMPSKKEMFEAIGDPNDPVTQQQLSSSMSTILVRIQQGLSSLGGGGAGLYEIQGLIDSLDDKRQSILDSTVGNLLTNLLGQIDSIGGDLSALNTDFVPEGPSGDNLYYRETRVESFVDSDYVQERMGIPNTLTFKGGVNVAVDAAPASPDNGDVYVNDTEGVALASWTGIAGDTITEAQALAWAEGDSRWYEVGSMSQDNESLIKDAVDKAVPVGSVTMWMGTSSPAGYFLCRGGVFNTSTYPELHAHLGSTYSGYVSGILPDFRGRFPGGDGAHGLEPLDGKLGRLYNQMTADPTTTGLSSTVDTSGVSATSSATTTVASNGSHKHDAATDTSISGGNANTSSAGGHHHDTTFHTNKDNTASNKGENVNLLTQYHNNGNETTRQTADAGSHSHTVDLSSIEASSTTTTENAGSHAHTATTDVTTNLNGMDLEIELDGFDPYTRPYAFNVNYIIKHDTAL